MVELDGHAMTVEYREDYAPAYGDEVQVVKRPWLVCGCGWDQPVNDLTRSDERLLRLEHTVEVLDARNCDHCRSQAPCPRHCPRRRDHGAKSSRFCASCGLRAEGSAK